MSSTGVREANDTNKRVIKGLIQNEAQFIQSLRVFSNTSTLSGLGSTEGEINNSPKDPSGNYLSRLGDTMLGPFALSPPLDFRIVIDANNTIDIGPLNDNAQYTSNVQLDSIQPNGFVLDIIANAAFDGQLLFLRTFAPTSPFTISQGTLGNGGNIQTGDGNDLTVGDLQTVTLIFDEALKIGANTRGSWRILSVSSGGGSSVDLLPLNNTWTGTNTWENISTIKSGLQISDASNNIHSLLQGLTGITRLTLTAGEKLQIFDNITGILDVDSAFGVNVKALDIRNADRIQIIGGTPSATSVNDVVWYLDSNGNLVSNVNATDGWIWSSGNIPKMILTDSILEKRNVTAPSFQLYNTRAAQTGTAGTINILANSTSVPTGISMASIIADTEVIAGSGIGSMKLAVNLSGVPTAFLSLNDSNDGVVKLLKSLNINFNNILGLIDLSFAGTASLLDVAGGNDLLFTEASSPYMAYDGGTNSLTLEPGNDVLLEPTDNIILNPTNGEVDVFADLDMQGTNTIDFGTSASVPVGSAIGAIQVKINGVTRLVKFYST